MAWPLPLVRLAFRERGRRRTRVRPNAAGNYITARIYNMVYWLAFPRTDGHYIQWDSYVPPYTLPVGYIFAPPPDPPWRLLGPVTSPDAAPTISDVPEPYRPVAPPSAPALPSYPSAPFTPPAPPLFPTLPPEARPRPVLTIPLPAEDFFADTRVTGTSPTPLATAPIPARSILILAHPENTEPVLFRSIRQGAGVGSIPPGMGVVIEVDDPSKVLVWSQTGNQTYTVAWELMHRVPPGAPPAAV